MRVELPEIQSHSMFRIKDQIESTVPVDLAKKDFVFGVTIGYQHARDLATKHKDKLVLLNACYISALGKEHEWREVWSNCLGVVSYLDLPVKETLFIRAPMSFDPEKFYFKAANRDKGSALVTGYLDGRPAEEIISVAETFSPTYHLGPNMSDKIENEKYMNMFNIPDEMLNRLYNKAEFVAGMRYVEGFEMPAIEGMTCGATPIVFDLPCYRHWFDGIALFVDPEKDIPSQLRQIKTHGGLDEGMLVSESYQFRQDVVWDKIWEELRNVLQDAV